MVAAEAVLEAPTARVFAFLADLDRHWQLVPGLVDVVATERGGALLRLRGPFGVHRTVRTRVTAVSAPLELSGRALTAGRTSAAVAWSLTPNGRGTLVRLDARVEHATLLDRVLLAAGGRAWLARTFAHAIRRLGELTS